jgi:acyl carrier protein
MLRKIVDDFLLTQTHISPEKLADPSIKMVDLGLDSLGVVEMLFEVEDRYGIHIEDAMQYQSRIAHGANCPRQARRRIAFIDKL